MFAYTTTYVPVRPGTIALQCLERGTLFLKCYDSSICKEQLQLLRTRTHSQKLGTILPAAESWRLINATMG